VGPRRLLDGFRVTQVSCMFFFFSLSDLLLVDFFRVIILHPCKTRLARHYYSLPLRRSQTVLIRRPADHLMALLRVYGTSDPHSSRIDTQALEPTAITAMSKSETVSIPLSYHGLHCCITYHTYVFVSFVCSLHLAFTIMVSRSRDVSRIKPRTGFVYFRSNTMSKSSPPTPKTPSSASLPPSLATSLPPFSTTSIARLQALYSDFSRQKQSNATSYHANVEWWRKALEALVSSGKQDYQSHLQFDEDAENSVAKNDRLVLHAGRELIERLKIPKAGKPLALGAVLVRKTLGALAFFFQKLICSLVPASPNSRKRRVPFSLFLCSWIPKVQSMTLAGYLLVLPRP
jgi:hypothetical protein